MSIKYNINMCFTKGGRRATIFTKILRIYDETKACKGYLIKKARFKDKI